MRRREIVVTDKMDIPFIIFIVLVIAVAVYGFFG